VLIDLALRRVLAVAAVGVPAIAGAALAVECFKR
jgi:hypothetical protein